ncbi:MAG TPA: LCP family protein [Anaerolineae bacterium]|nr:LCP family protein [Anaerolineae bacterium]
MTFNPEVRQPRPSFGWWIGLAVLLGALVLLIARAPQTSPPATLTQWSGTERFNILLLGIDERTVETGPWRTDTLMLASIDPVKRSAGVLSIPRDLWVRIPGYEVEGKINTAHFIGEAQGYPGGGPALAMAAVQFNFDIPIHYYLRLNFGAFEQLIDLIGGVDIYVDQVIDNPLYPDAGFGYDPLYIPAGWQHMDGRLALKYARTRHTALGDFDRIQHQQQVILAVRDKIVQAEMLPTLIGQIGPLLETLGDSFKTNLTPEQLIQLANLGAQIDPENIEWIAIEPSMTTAFLAQTEPPQAALIPLPAELRKVRARLLNLANATPSTTVLPTPQPALHLVQPGDTLFSLAQRYGVTVEAIMNANDLTTFDIYAGQELVIPPP